MPYNARLLARARARLSDIREENAAERQKRIRNVYAKVPEIEAIDDKLRSQMIELAKLAVTRRESSDEKIAALRDNNLTLQMRRAELLVENGFPLTWTDEIYSCPHCHDTGRVSSGICSCLFPHDTRNDKAAITAMTIENVLRHVLLTFIPLL